MPYTDPRKVDAPKTRLKNLDVIYESPDKSWAAATFSWDGVDNCLGMRWNGDGFGAGSPQSRGVATWFVIPEDLAGLLREGIKLLK